MTAALILATGITTAMAKVQHLDELSQNNSVLLHYKFLTGTILKQ